MVAEYCAFCGRAYDRNDMKKFDAKKPDKKSIGWVLGIGECTSKDVTEYACKKCARLHGISSFRSVPSKYTVEDMVDELDRAEDLANEREMACAI